MNDFSITQIINSVKAVLNDINNHNYSIRSVMKYKLRRDNYKGAKDKLTSHDSKVDEYYKFLLSPNTSVNFPIYLSYMFMCIHNSINLIYNIYNNNSLEAGGYQIPKFERHNHLYNKQ